MWTTAEEMPRACPVVLTFAATCGETESLDATALRRWMFAFFLAYGKQREAPRDERVASDIIVLTSSTSRVRLNSAG